VWLSGLAGLGLQRWDEVPGQEFLDAADGMVGDLRQHGAEVELRIETVELGRADEAVERGGAIATGVGAGEQIVFPSKSDSTDILPISVKN